MQPKPLPTTLRNNEVQLLAKFKNEDDFVKLDSWKKKQNQQLSDSLVF